MLDVGLVWDARTTIQRAKLFEPLDLRLIEEPLPPSDLRGYGRVSAAITQRLAAGEEECTLEGFARLIDEGGIDLAQVNVTRCGLTVAMEIVAYAQPALLVATTTSPPTSTPRRPRTSSR